MRRRRKNIRNIKIFVGLTICLLFIMTVGYAAFRTNINIMAKGNVNPRNSLYVASTGNDQTGRGTKDRPYQTISKAYDVASSEATIYIMDNLTIDETVTFDKDKKITLTSEDNEINSLLRGNEDEMLLKISSGETILTNITLDGQNKEANYTLLKVETNAIVNLNIGTTIQNNINNIDSGGGIFVNHGTMTINEAVITNNQAMVGGGGGFLARHSTVTINSGEISNNQALNGGGILFGDQDGILTMNGGEIVGNIANITQGGGIALLSARMIMNGGNISYNISKMDGGGIYASSIVQSPDVGSTLTIKIGEISNNTANRDGGGIWYNKISTYVNESGIVSDNNPDNVYKA